MQLQSYHPQYVSLITALIISIGVCIALLGFLWPRRSIPGVYPVLGALTGVIFWCAGDLLTYLSTTLHAKLIFFDVSYVGIVSIPVLWLFFALQYTGRSKWLTPSRASLFFIIPAITFIMQITNDFHSFMYLNLSLSTTGPFPVVEKVYGPWFWTAAAYNYVVLSIAIILLIRRLFGTPRLYLGQAMYLFVVVFFPVAANLGYLLKIIPYTQIDWTPAAFAISAMAMTFAITRERLLELVPVGRESVIELMSEGFVVLDYNGRIVDFNESAREILELPLRNVLGQTLPQTIADKLHLEDRYRDGQSIKMEIQFDEEERPKHFSVNISPLYVHNKSTCGFVLIFHDITERKLAEEAIKQIAYYDALTGLPNRTLFHDRAAMALEEARRHQRKLAIMVVDLDRFKWINDNLGHDVGDEVLKYVGEKLISAVRKIDTVSRLGGDEFTVLLPEIAEDNIVIGVAKRMMSSVAKPFTIGTKDIGVTMSVGMAVYPDDGNDLALLLKNADIAMYSVKQSGRNNYKRYNADLSPGIGQA